MTKVASVYFGCVERSGHYYFDKHLNHLPRIERTNTNISGPWGEHIDSSQLQAGPNHGNIKLHKRAGWTCLMITDNYVDHRGNSKSAFLFAILDIDLIAAYELAKEYYPSIINRIEGYKNYGPLI